MIYLPVSGSGRDPRSSFGMEATKAVFVPEPSGFGARSALDDAPALTASAPSLALAGAARAVRPTISLHGAPGDFLRVRRVMQAALCNRGLWVFEGECGQTVAHRFWSPERIIPLR